MRWTMVSLCVLMTACSGQNLNSPTSPTGSVGVSAARLGPGVSQTQARGGTGLPFEGSFTRQSHATFEPPITLVITGTEAGRATHLGRFTATSEDRVDTTIPAGTGTFNFTASNGDELWTATVGVSNESPAPSISNVTLAATIVGGTGRFADATGTLTIRFTETIDFATNSATGSGTIEGQLNLNR
jgi:hypothetical protein